MCLWKWNYERCEQGVVLCYINPFFYFLIYKVFIRDFVKFYLKKSSLFFFIQEFNFFFWVDEDGQA